MSANSLNALFEQYTNRKKRVESDCAVVEKVWLEYQKLGGKEKEGERLKALSWLLDRLEDKDTNKLVRNIICNLMYKTRKKLPKEFRKRFRSQLKKMPRNKKGKFKFRKK